MAFVYNATELAKLEEIHGFLTKIPDYEEKMGLVIRKSLDEVIDGARTGRVSITELEKTEQTYIGTKVEIILRADLELVKGKLDTTICGHDVDIKWSKTYGKWMIPKECVNEACLLITADDAKSTFSVGLIIASKELLTIGKNQDLKRNIAAKDRGFITWLVDNGKLPENFLLKRVSQPIRDKIFKYKKGQPRVTALFREVQEVVIPRIAVETVAQQKDPMRRLRETRKILKKEGILLLGGQESADLKVIEENGLPSLSKGDSMSIAISKLTYL